MPKLSIDHKTIGDPFGDKEPDFLIPDYQRPYAWTEDECATLHQRCPFASVWLLQYAVNTAKGGAGAQMLPADPFERLGGPSRSPRLEAVAKYGMRISRPNYALELIRIGPSK